MNVEEQAEQQNLRHRRSGRAIDELRQESEEEERHLRVQHVRDHRLHEYDPQPRSRQIRHCCRRSRARDQLNADDHQVDGAGDAHRVVGERDGSEQSCKTERERGDVDQRAGRDAERREDARGAPVAHAARGDVQHVRAGRQVERQRRGHEHEHHLDTRHGYDHAMPKFALGQGISRLEDETLLRGAGRYADDFTFAGAAHAVIVRSPHAHARIRKISASKSPGVIAVLTGKDAAADGLGEVQCLIPVVNLDGTNRKETPRPVLALDTVRHVGDPVAVVIAETLAQAKDAAEQVEVDYETLPAVTDVREGEIAFDIGLGQSREKVEQAMRQAAHVTRLELVNNRLVANPIEPRAALAEYKNGSVTLVTPSQGPHHLRGQIAGIVKSEDVRVVSGNVGGAFGMKIFLYPEQPMMV